MLKYTNRVVGRTWESQGPREGGRAGCNLCKDLMVYDMRSFYAHVGWIHAGGSMRSIDIEGKTLLK